MLYETPWFLRNGHLQSILPTLYRKPRLTTPHRLVLPTPDGDFLCADWYRGGNDRAVVISHGLEGHNRRHYVMGMARAFLAAGWDVMAWNFRSCGGVMNRRLRFYHSGATEDLAVVVDHLLAASANYQQLGLVGFSMGGNLSLVYLGAGGDAIDPRVCGCVTFSVPCDLAASADQLALPANRIYMKRFLRELRAKIIIKHRLYPDQIRIEGLQQLQNFHEFDDQYTAPLHGFRDAQDYWMRCSSAQFLTQIRRPALIVNALDDPFLSDACYPHAQVKDAPWVQLETPDWGGHVGFVSLNRSGLYWSEQRAVAFLNDAACRSDHQSSGNKCVQMDSNSWGCA